MYLILRVMRHEVCCSVIYGFFTINYKKAFYSLLISILHIAIIPCNKTQTYSLIRIFFSVFYYFFYYNFFSLIFQIFFFFFFWDCNQNRLKLTELDKNSFSRIFFFVPLLLLVNVETFCCCWGLFWILLRFLNYFLCYLSKKPTNKNHSKNNLETKDRKKISRSIQTKRKKLVWWLSLHITKMMYWYFIWKDSFLVLLNWNSGRQWWCHDGFFDWYTGCSSNHCYFGCKVSH